MAQYRYSEAPFIITTNRTDLASCTEIHVTFEQGATQVDKTGEALTIAEDGTTIITRMTQEEAATFTAGQAAKMQVTLLDPDGFRFVSNVVVGNVGESLIDSVIPVAAEGGEG